jgi:[ribosomal protein S5]-alanine N-acetyltransferase
VSEEWRTEQLLARRPLPSDREAYHGLFLDPQVGPWLRPPPLPPFNRAEVSRMLDEDTLHWDEHGFGPWALIEQESGLLVGRGGLRWTTIEGEVVVELPWAIASEHWCRGMATEAASAALGWSRSLGFDRVFALIRPENRASRRVAGKAGLRLFGETEHAGLTHLLYCSSAEQPIASR